MHRPGVPATGAAERRAHWSRSDTLRPARLIPNTTPHAGALHHGVRPMGVAPRRTRRVSDLRWVQSPMTSRKCSGRLGVTRPTIYRYLGSGELRSFRLGSRRLISAEALADFIRS